jgi:carbonic anhydrase/acetyltransferase-like protein (isoleucine patch superfamily)
MCYIDLKWETARSSVLIGKEIPPRTLAVGVPAKIKKQLKQTGKMEGVKAAGAYVENGKLFKEFFT